MQKQEKRIIEINENLYFLEDLIKTEMFKHKQDALRVVLRPDEKITIKNALQRLEEFMEKKV